MAWLLRRGEVLASVTVIEPGLGRARGFSGAAEGERAVLLIGARSAHTIGVHQRIDVAYLGEGLVVLATGSMAPFRIGRPRRRCTTVLQAEAGAFERWGLQCGDALEVRP